MEPYRVSRGKPEHFGTTLDAEGANFTLFSRHATAVELLLYRTADSAEPFQIIPLNPAENRSFFFWHVQVEGLPAGIHYTWRVQGPDDTARTGHRFNAKKELVSPAAKAVTDWVWDRKRASDPDDAARSSMRAVVTDEQFNWEGEPAIAKALKAPSFTRSMSARLPVIPHPASCIRPRSPG